MIIERHYTGLPEGCHLNPMQELMVPHMNKDYNVVVAAPTASGKSQAITMFGHKFLEKKKRVLYIGIMRALAQEKSDDWDEEGHPWKERRKTVISGDYKMDAAKQLEIDNAEIICITPESLASRLRHPNSPRNKWLHEVGVLVVDEIHLLSSGDRGTNMEAALVEFTYEFPKVQIVGLSATMPNVHQIGEWLTKLNNKKTEIIESDYRPVVLQKHFIPTYQMTKDDLEEEKMQLIEDLVMGKEDQQFLICVWQKTWGKKIEDYLKSLKVPVAFHNANHDKVTRRDIESNFKAGNLRVLISTSTLFTGVNLPARNVIITAVEAARQDIPVYELQQAMGRAGRPRYDTEGDVYLFLPQSKFNYHQRRIENGEPIQSCMHEREWLAMHFLGAQYLGRIDDVEGFSMWFDRTLAQHQQNLNATAKATLLTTILNDMKARRMVMYDDYTQHFRLAHRGKIAAQMYLDPYHFSDMLMNIARYASLAHPNDVDLAIALGSCRGFADLSMSRAEQDNIPDAILQRGGVKKEYQKACGTIWYRISGVPVPNVLANTNYRIFEDMPRMHAAVSRANDEVEHWKGITSERLDMLFTRVILRCTEENAEFGMRKFTRTERKKLNALGVYSFRDAMNNLSSVVKVIPFSRCVELGLAKAGSKPPKVNEDGIVERVDPGMRAASGFGGKRGFGVKKS